MNQEERDPFDYYWDEKAPNKSEQFSSDDIVNNMRSDLLTASEVEPEKKSFFQQVDPKLIVGIFIGLIILCLILYLLLGPGMTFLGNKLASLRRNETTPTQQVIPTQILYTNTPKQPTRTPTKIPTVRPTNTISAEIITTSTQIPASATSTTTPTSASDCRDALSITLEDVGQTLCVQGTIIETITNPTNFMVIFSTDKGSLYWLTYDPGMVTGRIEYLLPNYRDY